MKCLVMALSMGILVGCSQRGIWQYHNERKNKDYREAMADYSAGRMPQAAKLFAKVLAVDPGHTSARFQLACVEQDALGDPLSAWADFREFLRIDPESDRAVVATRRLQQARAAIFTENKVAANEKALRAELAKERSLRTEAEKAVAELTSQQSEDRKKLRLAEEEVSRLRKRILTLGDDENTKAAIMPTLKELLEDEPTPMAPDMEAVKSLFSETEDDTPPFKTETVKTNEPNLAKHPEVKEGVLLPKPKTYTVKDGDTLYKLALQFYGKTSAWKIIRDANKETVSTDGRIREGQVLKLP